MLASKGFKEAVVSLTSDGADVVVSAAELSEANRAQIGILFTKGLIKQHSRSIYELTP